MDKLALIVRLNLIMQGYDPEKGTESANQHNLQEKSEQKQIVQDIFEYVTPITDEYIEHRSKYPRAEPEEIMEEIYNKTDDGVFRLTNLGMEIHKYILYKSKDGNIITDGKAHVEYGQKIRCNICEMVSRLVNWQREYEGK